MEYVIVCLIGDGSEPRWKSLRRLLRFMGMNSLEFLNAESGIGNREAVIEQIVGYFPSLPTMKSEMLDSTLAKLDPTWRELDRASMMLNEYIRSNFHVIDGG
jgi:hypothetical protein